jgi:hypothetical protein
MSWWRAIGSLRTETVMSAPGSVVTMATIKW